MSIQNFKEILWKPKNKRFFYLQLELKIYYKVLQSMTTPHKAPYKT